MIGVQVLAGARNFPLSLGMKWQGHEADYTPPSSAKFKNVWSYTFTPQYTFMVWCSVKAEGQLYLLVEKQHICHVKDLCCYFYCYGI
jgi:hypothetical protein